MWVLFNILFQWMYKRQLDETTIMCLYISCNTLPPNSSKWNKAGGNIDNIRDQFCPISESGNLA